MIAPEAVRDMLNFTKLPYALFLKGIAQNWKKSLKCKVFLCYYWANQIFAFFNQNPTDSLGFIGYIRIPVTSRKSNRDIPILGSWLILRCRSLRICFFGVLENHNSQLYTTYCREEETTKLMWDCLFTCLSQDSRFSWNSPKILTHLTHLPHGSDFTSFSRYDVIYTRTCDNTIQSGKQISC